MEIFLTCLLFAVGIVLIVFGGDFFVDAATWMAKISGLPNFVIGATIVSVATTLPELIVSIMAAASGSVDLAVGNAVGSVTANTGLIMGISLVFAPFCMKRS
ncbi:MAG: sodium:calcium antiporter, partial [Bacillota bacterium]